MNTLLRRFTSVQVLFVLIAIICAVPSLVRAEDWRQRTLEQAVQKLWLNNDSSAEVRKALSDIASGASDQIAAKALFHLGCAEAMAGNRDAAKATLEQVQKLAPAAGEVGQAEAMKRLLMSAGERASAPLSLDLNGPIKEAIMKVAAVAGRAVIIDGEIEERQVALMLPEVKFEEVMKILSEMGNFQMSKVGDIVLVTPKSTQNPPADQKEGKISLDLKNVAIVDALRLIAAKTDLNVVAHRHVAGKITIRLSDVYPDDALNMIARSNDLYLKREGNIILVVQRNDIEQVFNQRTKVAIPLQFLKPHQVQMALRERPINVNPSQDGKSVVIEGEPEAVSDARDTILNIDKPQKAVTIAVKIWELASDSTQLDSPEFGKLSDDAKRQHAKLISAPRVLTLPGQEATIEMTSSDHGDSKEGDIKLKMLPQILPDNLVQLDCNGHIRTKSGVGGDKQEQKREFKASFIVKPGTTFMQMLKGNGAPLILEYQLNLAE